MNYQTKFKLKMFSFIAVCSSELVLFVLHVLLPPSKKSSDFRFRLCLSSWGLPIWHVFFIPYSQQSSFEIVCDCFCCCFCISVHLFGLLMTFRFFCVIFLHLILYDAVCCSGSMDFENWQFREKDYGEN